ncbi:MAG: ABC transporter permease subunit [Thermoplasmata archaeon]
MKHYIKQEVKRALRSRSLYIVILVFVLLGVLTGSEAVYNMHSSEPSMNNVNAYGAYFYKNGTYFIDSYFMWSSGKPVSSSSLSLTFLNGPQDNSFTLYNKSAFSGFVNTTFNASSGPVNKLVISLSADYSFIYGGSPLYGNVQFYNFTDPGYFGVLAQRFGSSYAKDSYVSLLSVILLEPGKAFAPLKLYMTSPFSSSSNYTYITTVHAQVSTIDVSPHILYHNYSGPVQYVYYNYKYIPENGSLSSPSSTIYFGPQDVAVTSPGPVMMLSALLNGFSIIYLLIIPVMAIVVGYSLFGSQKGEGILESVLVRPVTRTQIITVRYMISSFFLALAVFLMIAPIYLTPLVMGDGEFPSGTLSIIAIALFAESLTFLTITFLISVLGKKSDRIMSTSLLLFVVFSIVIPLLMSVMLSNSMLGSYTTSVYELVSFVNPSSIAGDVMRWGNSLISIILAGPHTLSPAYSIATMPVVLSWIILPLLYATFRWNKSD